MIHNCTVTSARLRGGKLVLRRCPRSGESHDGRSAFELQSNNQLKLPRMGNICVTLLAGGQKIVVQDCNEASQNADAQDKFFLCGSTCRILHGPRATQHCSMPPPLYLWWVGAHGRPEGSERYRDFHLTSYLGGWGLVWSEQCVDGAGANIDFTFLRYTNLCYSAILAPIFPAPSLLACQYALPTLSMQCHWCVAELRSA